MTTLLEVNGLNVGFRTPYGVVQALSDTTLTLQRGELLLIVGESGSGKTVFAHTLLRLLPMNTQVTGSVRLNGEELLCLPESAMRQVRGRRMALIPQSPGTALNPVRRLGSLLLELARAREIPAPEVQRQMTDVLGEFDLDFEHIRHLYPHQLSGGMQQRVVNALALIGTPELVIADEPTSGLDADLVDATAAQLQRIRAQGAALLVITHDLRLAEKLGGRLALMYASYMVEIRQTEQFFNQPAHPYGRGLLQALPERGGVPLPGLPLELTALPAYCPFLARCPDRLERCGQSVPSRYPLPDQSGQARCFLYVDR